MVKNSDHPEKIQPLFINTDNATLYVCHHEPLINNKTKTPIIICPPVGHEYERCHRAIRQLALQLAKAGFHVFRFDYSGTGNSAGNLSDVSISEWIADISAVTNFSMLRAGADSAFFIGMRLGATLALESLKNKSYIKAICLWSPILEGTALLEEWTDIQHKHERALSYPIQAPPISEVLGYPISKRMFEDIKNLSLGRENNRITTSNIFLAHHETGNNLKRIIEKLQLNDNLQQIQTSENINIWDQESMEAVVPFEMINHIVSWAKKVLS